MEDLFSTSSSVANTSHLIGFVYNVILCASALGALQASLNSIRETQIGQLSSSSLLLMGLCSGQNYMNQTFYESALAGLFIAGIRMLESESGTLVYSFGLKVGETTLPLSLHDKLIKLGSLKVLISLPLSRLSISALRYHKIF